MRFFCFLNIIIIKIKELKKEKLYLKDKIGSAESSVVSFIGEMNEVLDNHEITAMFID